MNVSLTPELEAFIEKEVRTGLYQTASEVIRAGLRRLKDEQDRNPSFLVSSQLELHDKLVEGVRQLDRGESTRGEDAFKRLRQRAKNRSRNG